MLKKLIDSFAVGNVLKNGIPVAIVGEPNVGKSTLLNALLNEERAIVSDIAGTTRDSIEDEMSIGGIGFRFIDTAGIRETEDIIEGLGIKKTFEKISQSQVVIYLLSADKLGHAVPIDIGIDSESQELETLKPVQGDVVFIKNIQVELQKIHNQFPQKPLLIIVNKVDTLKTEDQEKLQQELEEISRSVEKSQYLLLSAKTGMGVEELKQKLLQFVNTGELRNNNTIVTNSRHYNALLSALEEINKVQQGLNDNLSGDLMAIDIRQALYHFGEITGEITNDDLLGNIFANFCIGK